MQNKVVYVIVSVMAILNVSLGYFAFTEPPDYIITVSPGIVTTDQGGSVKFNVVLSSLRGFDAKVNLRVAEMPEGVKVALDNNVTRVTAKENVSVTANVTVDPAAPAGLYSLVIEANSGGLVHSATEQLDIIGKGRVIVIIENFWFYPDNLTVRKGTEVTWVNKDLTGHTATAYEGEFDSKLLRQNQRYTFVFGKTGVYSYYCVPHPQMIAAVKVVE